MLKITNYSVDNLTSLNEKLTPESIYGSLATQLTSPGLTTKKRKSRKPATAIINPGIMKDSAQSVSTYLAAMREPLNVF